MGNYIGKIKQEEGGEFQGFMTYINMLKMIIIVDIDMLYKEGTRLGNAYRNWGTDFPWQFTSPYLIEI